MSTLPSERTRGDLVDADDRAPERDDAARPEPLRREAEERRLATEEPAG